MRIFQIRRRRRFYILNEAEQQQGPLSMNELRELRRQGSIGFYTFCWEEGTPEWIYLGKLSGIDGEMNSSQAGWRRFSVIGTVLGLTLLLGFAGYVLFIEQRDPKADLKATTLSQLFVSRSKPTVQTTEPREIKQDRVASSPTGSTNLEDPDTLLDLGANYFDGTGVPRDERKGLAYFEAAAKRGSSAAMFALGVIYQFGRGEIKQDLPTAKKYYEAAVERGNGSAMLPLGGMYYDGSGVKRDIEHGRKLISTAAARGVKGAKEVLAQIDSQNAESSSYKNNTAQLTCDEWIAKAGRAFPDLKLVGLRPGGLQIGQADAFLNVMGPPGKKIRAADSTLMVFFCSDGAVILDVHSALLSQAGMMFVKAIETR